MVRSIADLVKFGRSAFVTAMAASMGDTMRDTIPEFLILGWMQT